MQVWRVHGPSLFFFFFFFGVSATGPGSRRGGAPLVCVVLLPSCFSGRPWVCVCVSLSLSAGQGGGQAGKQRLAIRFSVLLSPTLLLLLVIVFPVFFFFALGLSFGSSVLRKTPPDPQPSL